MRKRKAAAVESAPMPMTSMLGANQWQTLSHNISIEAKDTDLTARTCQGLSAQFGN